MNKLSRKKALEITRDLWDWLAKHPSKRKEDWVGWEYNGGKIGTMSNNCPCCEYIGFIPLKDIPLKDNCSEICPLKNLWKKGCMIETSAFQRWYVSKDERIKQKYAKQIADACRKELSKGRRVIV